MNRMKDEEYYSLMLNALAGLQDDLAANQAPPRAIELMRIIVEICTKDYNERFPNERQS